MADSHFWLRRPLPPRETDRGRIQGFDLENGRGVDGSHDFSGPGAWAVQTACTPLRTTVGSRAAMSRGWIPSTALTPNVPQAAE